MSDYGIEVHRVEQRLFRQELQTIEPMPLPGQQEKNMAIRHMSSTRIVTINREKLLEKLKENREQHKVIYNEAHDGFQQELRETMQKVGHKLVDYVEQGIVKELTTIRGLAEEIIDLELPQHHLKAYDQAISIFTWDQATDIELSVDEFVKFVDDDWSWQEQYLLSTGRQGSKSAAAAILRRSAR